MKVKYRVHTHFDATTDNMGDYINQYLRENYTCTELINSEYGLTVGFDVMDDMGGITEVCAELPDEWFDRTNWGEEVDGVVPFYIDEELVERIRAGEEAEKVLSKEDIDDIYLSAATSLEYDYIFGDKESIEVDYPPKCTKLGDTLLFTIPDADSYFDLHYDYDHCKSIIEEEDCDHIDIQGETEFETLARDIFNIRKLYLKLKQEPNLSFIKICDNLGVIFELAYSDSKGFTLYGWCKADQIEKVLATANKQIEKLATVALKRSDIEEICKVFELTETVDSLKQSLEKTKKTLKDTKSKLAKSQEDLFTVKAERDAHRLFITALHQIDEEVWAGPLLYKDGKVRVIVSVNDVKLPTDSIWYRIAFILAKKYQLPIQAIERHASAWMRPKLPFEGSFADWADVEHAFGRTASITDKEIQWDFISK